MTSIVDVSGKPLKADNTLLSEDIAKAYTTSVRNPRPASVASTLNPLRLAGLLRSVVDGNNPEDYMTLAEEMEEHHKIMALDLETGQTKVEDLGDFNRGNDPEGIALVINKDNTGYWICTEQSKTDNRFHLYDRQTLERISTMYLEDVSYTDGITTAYMHGNWYLYAVDNDKRVVAFQLPEIN